MMSYLSRLPLVPQNTSGVVVNQVNEHMISATVYSNNLKKVTTTEASIGSKISTCLSANYMLDTEHTTSLIIPIILYSF